MTHQTVWHYASSWQKSQHIASRGRHWMTWKAAGNSPEESTKIEKWFVPSPLEISGIGSRKLHIVCEIFLRCNSIRWWLNSIGAQRVPKIAEGTRCGRWSIALGTFRNSRYLAQWSSIGREDYLTLSFWRNCFLYLSTKFDNASFRFQNINL